jgi:hypothetical protein
MSTRWGGNPRVASASFSNCQVQRRQGRAEAEGPWREQHVLHRGMIS